MNLAHFEPNGCWMVYIATKCYSIKHRNVEDRQYRNVEHGTWNCSTDAHTQNMQKLNAMLSELDRDIAAHCALLLLYFQYSISENDNNNAGGSELTAVR